MVQGGDIVKGDGTGKLSIYGSAFEDEAGGLRLAHASPGSECPMTNHFRLDPTRPRISESAVLSMANSGPGTNGCQFFITTVATPWLDGKHVVFGRLMDSDSLLVLRKLENVPTGAQNRPKLECKIAECGEL